VDTELEKMWKESTVAQFKIVFQNIKCKDCRKPRELRAASLRPQICSQGLPNMQQVFQLLTRDVSCSWNNGKDAAMAYFKVPIFPAIRCRD
jgi:hypothetical protein